MTTLFREALAPAPLPPKRPRTAGERLVSRIQHTAQQRQRQRTTSDEVNVLRIAEEPDDPVGPLEIDLARLFELFSLARGQSEFLPSLSREDFVPHGVYTLDGIEVGAHNQAVGKASTGMQRSLQDPRGHLGFQTASQEAAPCYDAVHLDRGATVEGRGNWMRSVAHQELTTAAARATPTMTSYGEQFDTDLPLPDGAASAGTRTSVRRAADLYGDEFARFVEAFVQQHHLQQMRGMTMD